MKYSECKPIETRAHSVWRIRFEDGEEWLQVWAHDTPIGRAIELTSIRNPERPFAIQLAGVGTYRLHEQSCPEECMQYSGDSRWVTSEMEMVLDYPPKEGS